MKYHVASQELCEELHELSGWPGTGEPVWSERDGSWYLSNFALLHGDSREIPAYGLGYLMRSLPDGFAIVTRFNDGWLASWAPRADEPDIGVDAATPEDAVCKLAIELFKQAVLSREGTS